MARKPSAKDAAALAVVDKLLRVLESQRLLGEGSYPLTLERLVQLTEPGVAPLVLRQALGKRVFTSTALSVRGKDHKAPVSLLTDVDQLAGSGLTLEYLLRFSRSDATQAFSLAELKKRATGKLQKPFQDAINRQIASNTLPPSVGWISITGRKRLFLLSDLHTSARPAAVPEVVPAVQPARPSASTPAFEPAFDAAFTHLDRQLGGRNFVSLVELRRAVPCERERFDAGLHQLRLAGRYTLSAAEGRDGITPEERDAGIPEEGSLLLFVSRSLP